MNIITAGYYRCYACYNSCQIASRSSPKGGICRGWDHHVAREGITLENGWKITPFTHPGVSFIYTLPLHLQSTCTFQWYFQQITKEQVNNFEPNCEDPNYCQLNVKWIGQQEQPEELMHRVKLLGAKEPFDFFVIRLPPDLKLPLSHVAEGAYGLQCCEFCTYAR